MKSKIKMKTKGYELAVQVDVTLSQPQGYSREHIRQWKQKLETKLHAVLVEDGYAPSAIRFS